MLFRSLEQHRLTGRSHLRRIFFHMVQAEKEMSAYGASSKFNVHRDFIEVLFQLGRTTADSWLENNFSQVGVKTSIDMQKLFF